MVYLKALGIFLPITAAIWFVAVALYHLLTGGPDLRRNDNFAGASAGAILLVTLISLVPFPWGYVATLLVWWLAASVFLTLPPARAGILFLLLAVLSIVSRLAILGVLSF